MARISRLRLGVAAWALMVPTAAWAECATTTAGDGMVTINCGDTITNSAVNRNGNNPSTSANYQAVEAPLNLTVNSGVTINGWGLYLYSGSQPAATTPRPINVVNNGTISHTVGWDDPSESDGLNIGTNSGSIHYSGNGSVTTNGTANATGNFVGSTALVIHASGLGNSVTVGSQTDPLGGTFTGEGGLRLVAENSSLDAWFAGGTITATRRDNGVGALDIQASDSINLTMAGGTVVNGGISVSLTAGPGHGAASALTIITDARVTNSYSAGAGLTAFSREAGANVTLTSGAAISVANVGVILNAITGQSRFTTAAGTTIDQTGTTGAVRAGLWFAPTGTGSLVADLSGAIAATGTGILLQPVNGNASVAIRAGGSVGGDQTGIQVLQSAGATGAVDIRNFGTLSGAVAVAGTPAGTAFTLINSGTMTGRVDVTGSAVVGSLFTNSGTWNSGGGNSTFAGSLTSSGTMNAHDGMIDTLTIDGNLVLAAGSVYRVDVGNNAADRINVTGTASLAGSLATFATGGTFTAGTYTLLTAAGGRSGTFSPLTTTPENASISLRYDANNVFLDIIAANPGQTFSFSSRESLVFNPATVITNRTAAYSTQIIGRLLGGTSLYDQTFAAAFADPLVQGGVTAARAAITAAGGPGVIVGDPVRIASTTTSTTITGASTYSLAGPGVVTTTGVTTFGPDTILTGALSTCNISSLPSTTRPTCTTGGTSVDLVDADENFNTITDTVYAINETRTDTITDTLREVYELNGQVVAVGTIHAEVQSGLFDLGGRLLGRLAGPMAHNAGWGEVYGFRVRQGGRRDATGFAAGFNLALAPQWSLAAGVDHGNLDIDVPGATETGDVTLTEGGAALRFDGGAFTAALSASYGTGKAETLRTIIGNSAANYDVRVAGVALDLGYAFKAGEWTLRPVAGIDLVSVRTDDFTESDMLGLRVARQHANRTRASVGLEVSRHWGGIDLSASARYLAVLDGRERSTPVAFAVAPTRLLVMTAASEPDTALLGARARIPVSSKASFFLGYDGRFGGGYTSHAGTIGFALSW
ncbi:autotransporter domain-containing protein [Sphingopyxis sp. DBS4]|uniref:autotransporter outer membrane beta-barrel domain-containing protein n=1 Tax=Sphingopyxis sp. DBS4 TaxID=2968500 RepID=UPI00214C8B51|nr:autotransporter domain-containing protein [Sphingopyxis sp. DBS4]